MPLCFLDQIFTKGVGNKNRMGNKNKETKVLLEVVSQITALFGLIIKSFCKRNAFHMGIRSIH